MKVEEYKTYLSAWMSGLQSEINFWNYYFQNEGGIYFSGFEDAVSKNKVFTLEDDIPTQMYGEKYKFIDVGSGPLSRCGRITDKVQLDAVYVDPLAYAYKNIMDKCNVDNGNRLKSGFVELLSKQFEPNTFDMVHMSNSLDHSFSAVDGIYQLLNICKIGGKVILRHTENEAENEKYEGLHQWNLSLHNDENSFIIWRNEERYDICKIFGEYAEIQLQPDEIEEGGWIYNKVVFIKKKELRMPKNKYYDIMLDVIYKELVLNILNMNNIERIVSKQSINKKDERIALIRKAYHQKEKLKKNGIKEKLGTVMIYGMGTVGTNLDYLLENCDINARKMDAKGKKSGCSETMMMEECKDFDFNNIIVTVDDKTVFNKLIEKSKKKNVVGIDDFLRKVMELV